MSTGMRVDVVVDIFINVLFGELGGTVTAALSRMGVDTLSGLDVNLLAAMLVVLECILSASLKTLLLSCSRYECWPMTVLDFDRALQASKPSDHL